MSVAAPLLSEDDFASQIGRDMVDAAREFREMTCGHAWKKMMFNMQEHIERDPVLNAMMQRSGKMVSPIAMVVDSPHGEKGSHALTDQHCAYVILQYPAMQHSEHHRDPYQAQQEFTR